MVRVNSFFASIMHARTLNLVNIVKFNNNFDTSPFPSRPHHFHELRDCSRRPHLNTPILQRLL